MRAIEKVELGLLAQRGHLIGWVPLWLGVGIGGYFALQFEPALWAFGLLGAAMAGLWAAGRLTNVAYAPVFMAFILIGAGAGLAKWRTVSVDQPVLHFRYYGAIEGRVVNIDRSASDAVRLTLDHVVLERMDPARTPARVRISLHGAQPIARFFAGETLITTGHLSQPSGPAEPGGFDFRRFAYFDELGAIGYTRNPVLRLAAAQGGGWRLWVLALRMRISQEVQRDLPGESGAFAAAILTGDRSAMAQGTLTALRASNLAHLLAISGLHMGLLTGFVFAVVRFILALFPWIALRLPTKKIAAIFAMGAGAFYLILSGGSVATVRAFIMVAVMLVAVLLDRRALTLRAVAIAAIVVLVTQPEALMGPGFQMSFAATTALVAVFGQLRRLDPEVVPRWAKPILSVVISSFIAGLATAPYGAAHFNQIAHYGLVANLLSVPLMGVLVMPAAVLAACLAPFGVWEIGLALMDVGLRWILFVANKVSGLEGALGHVPSPNVWVLPLLTIGLLWLILWQGRARLAGVAAVIAAFMVWGNGTRPAILVADTGALIGQMGPEGRVLSKPTGAGFVARVWLENDGSPVPQDVAAARDGFSRDVRTVWAQLEGWTIVQTSGKTALAALDGCGGADILVSNMADEVMRPCEVFDQIRLRDTGSLAFELEENGDLRVITAREMSGNRPWNAVRTVTAGMGFVLPQNARQHQD